MGVSRTPRNYSCVVSEDFFGFTAALAVFGFPTEEIERVSADFFEREVIIFDLCGAVLAVVREEAREKVRSMGRDLGVEAFAVTCGAATLRRA